MQKGSRSVWQVLMVLIAIGAVAGLGAAFKRGVVESRNKAVEIGLEYDEVSRLAQVSQRPLDEVIQAFRDQDVTSLILSEDLLASLEPSGQARATRVTLPGGAYYTHVSLDTPDTLKRVRDALTARGIPTTPYTPDTSLSSGTLFDVPDTAAVNAASSPPAQDPSPANTSTETGAVLPPGNGAFAVNYEYLNLRSLGLGLPRDSVNRITKAHMRVVARIGNFAGVTPTSARAVLQRLRSMGAKMVIFNGDEALGYRGLEKSVAAMLRDPAEAVQEKDSSSQRETGNKAAGEGEAATSETLPPTGLVYGSVEFGKQKGDEILASALHGDYVRVHAIQAAETGQLERTEIVDRFVRAARERNIRFCYVRLLTTAGGSTPEETPLQTNIDFVRDISHGIAQGGALTGGGYHFDSAVRYGETIQSRAVRAFLFGLIALGTAAGSVWMLREVCPLKERVQRLLLIGLSLVCVGLAVAGGEMGRKLVALLAGIAFPAVACLRAYPSRDAEPDLLSARPIACLRRATRAIGYASLITGIGILHVVGLLATRPFMLRANQFLGIKAQHAVPILLIVCVALIGGVPHTGETWTAWKRRAQSRLQALYEEPARFGLLFVGLVALAAFWLIVARTGNDSGVGASGLEMKTRAILDRLFPVRPRTKEFLVGHPAFILAIAWWWRGRRRLAIPAFIVGSIGQVSLLNTFCHIHTPLIISLWHGLLGLVLGVGLGWIVFLLGERLLPPVTAEEEEA